MVELKTEAEVEAMAAAGAVVAEALRAVADHARPGQSTTELDKVAAEVLARHGARSPFLNYHPAWAPAALPRGAVRQRQRRRRARHPQRPGARRRRPGLDRLRRDAARLVRRQRAQLRRRHAAAGGRIASIAATDDALAAGIAAVRPGNTLGRHRACDRVGRPRRRLRPAGRTTADTASAAPCTRIHTCRTKGAPARACGCGRGW